VLRGRNAVIHLSHNLLLEKAAEVARKLPPKRCYVYPVPRGGVPAAYLVLAAAARPTVRIVDKPELATVFVDDLVDSGRTRARYMGRYPGKPFFGLVDKSVAPFKGQWLVFPWEGAEQHQSIEDNIVRVLQYIGEDPQREGLKDTPKRVASALGEWFSGYKVNPHEVIRAFKDGAEECDEMVFVKDIPVYSHCEHHLAPIFGRATVAYVPNKRIIGLSKIPRLVEVFARRLQVQERLTNQISHALATMLKPRGVGVVIKARHLCMESRGIKQQGHETITSSLRGVFKKGTVRAEFLSLAR
jgi:GTP cyclohydrolase I